MRMNLSKRTLEEAPLTIPMTPMIDIIFQLILFFLCTMKFHVPEGQQSINLPVQGQPSAQVASPVPDIPLVLRRNPAGTPGDEDYVPLIRLSDSAVTSWKGLLDSLKLLSARNRDVRIVLDVAPEVIHENVVKALDQCAGAEVRNVSFAQPAKPRNP
jgi:biopolymer transport protein ExbD